MNMTRTTTKPNNGLARSLTTAERQLLQALSSGATNKRLAQALGKSEHTVRNQLSHVFKKVNASNRTQAAAWYRQTEHAAPASLNPN